MQCFKGPNDASFKTMSLLPAWSDASRANDHHRGGRSTPSSSPRISRRGCHRLPGMGEGRPWGETAGCPAGAVTCGPVGYRGRVSEPRFPTLPCKPHHHGSSSDSPFPSSRGHPDGGWGVDPRHRQTQRMGCRAPKSPSKSLFLQQETKQNGKALSRRTRNRNDASLSCSAGRRETAQGGLSSISGREAVAGDPTGTVSARALRICSSPFGTVSTKTLHRQNNFDISPESFVLS